MRISRRQVIGLPALGVGAVLLGETAAGADAGALDAYTDLRDRWCDIITGASKVDTGLCQPQRDDCQQQP